MHRSTNPLGYRQRHASHPIWPEEYPEYSTLESWVANRTNGACSRVFHGRKDRISCRTQLWNIASTSTGSRCHTADISYLLRPTEMFPGPIGCWFRLHIKRAFPVKLNVLFVYGNFLTAQAPYGRIVIVTETARSASPDPFSANSGPEMLGLTWCCPCSGLTHSTLR